MSMGGSDITVEILKDIRDEIRGVRTELREEMHGVRTDLHEEIIGVRTELQKHTERFGAVEKALLDLAEQQRFVVRYTKVISERDLRLEPRLSALETRVEKLESK
jgi:chromosome segregation ATPase